MAESHTELSSSERDHAVVALGIHFRDGRLTPEEFESRCARAHAVPTRDELGKVFTDLPEPHFDSVLNPGQPHLESLHEHDTHRYRNILDKPIYKSSITHRKFRIIGWIFAVVWIPLFGEAIELIMPEFMVVGALFAPIILMLAYTIAIKPTKPKYKYINPPQPQSPYPY